MDDTILTRHERIALHFSGGKDSIAVAQLLRAHWDRLTFYHVDAGDLLPDVRAVVADYEKIVPRFVRVQSDSRAWTRHHGLPSDLVPHTATAFGAHIGGHDLRLVSRYECCAHNLWLPMHQRMIADRISLVVRGSKRADMKRLPAESGDLNYELWLPLLDWSHDDVFAYLSEVGAKVPAVYDHVTNAPECATCPAWLDERRAGHLRAYPDLLAEYALKLRAVASMVMPEARRLNEELEALAP